uniref:Uncharacterized protein n=1 Tax=Toxoplasma gondii COUG TaxID=1074873 RepID=A0A2G8Y7K6_TOXGO|nr:hypothetical protein TGCOUG_392280 [Toxoplasma gondii COUG]
MTLPDEDENILFSEVADFSLFSLPGRRSAANRSDAAAPPSISDLLGVKDVHDDEEVGSAIWEAYDRLFSKVSNAVCSSSGSSVSSSSSSCSSASCVASPGGSPVRAAFVHIFCSRENVCDGFRVLYSFAFEAETGERSHEASQVVAALALCLLRCPACVVAYVCGCRQFLLALGRSRGGSQEEARLNSQATAASADDLTDVEDSEEARSFCARLQQKLLAWDLLRLLPVLAADRDCRDEENRQEDAAEQTSVEAGTRASRSETPPDIHARAAAPATTDGGENREIHMEIPLPRQTATDTRDVTRFSLWTTSEETEEEKGPFLDEEERLAVCRHTPSLSAGIPSTEDACRQEFRTTHLQGLLERLSQKRFFSNSSDPGRLVSATCYPPVPSTPSPAASSSPRSSCLSAPLASTSPLASSSCSSSESSSSTSSSYFASSSSCFSLRYSTVCALLEVLLDSARLLYVDFPLSLDSLQEDLRDFGSSLPALLLPLLRQRVLCLSPGEGRGGGRNSGRGELVERTGMERKRWRDKLEGRQKEQRQRRDATTTE